MEVYPSPLTFYTQESIFHNLYLKFLTPRSTPHTLHFTSFTQRFTLHTPHSTPHTLHFTHSTLPNPHFTLHTPYFTLHTFHSTLYTFHSTPQTGNRAEKCFRKVLCVTAYPCVSISVPLTYVWAFGFVGCILFLLFFDFCHLCFSICPCCRKFDF